MSAYGSSQGPALPQMGDIVDGKYALETLIGQGGMGAVYKARHIKLGHKVAIKVMLADAANLEAAQRFVNEGRAAANIQNEHVVRVSDVDEENGYAYMVLELLEGEDLAQVLDREKRLAPHVAVGYVLQALDGVKQAHAVGIVHRDLKPSNLFLARRNDGSVVVKVLDFGISKASAQSPLGQAPGALTSTKAMLGSPLYMSPEQLRSSKNVDARADIWAMGIIMFELMTGTLPFMGENLGELFAAILENDAPPLRSRAPDVSAGLEAVVGRCLQRRPEHRFQSVAELERELIVFSSAMAATGGGMAVLNPGQPGTVAMMMSRMEPGRGSDPYGTAIPPNTPNQLLPSMMSPPVGSRAPGRQQPPAHYGSNPGATTGSHPAAHAAPIVKGTVPLGAITPQLQAQPQMQSTGSAWQSTGGAAKGSSTTLVFGLVFAGLALVGILFAGYTIKKSKDAAAGGVPTSSATADPSSSATTAASTPAVVGSASGASVIASASSAPSSTHVGVGTGPKHPPIKPTEPKPPVVPPVVQTPPVAVADPPRPPPAKPPPPPVPPPALTGGTPLQTR